MSEVPLHMPPRMRFGLAPDAHVAHDYEAVARLFSGGVESRTCVACTVGTQLPRLHTTAIPRGGSSYLAYLACRDTKLMRKRVPLGPYRKTMPRALCKSQGGCRFLWARNPCRV